MRKFEKALESLQALRDEIAEEVEEREDLLDALVHAVLTRQHAFLFGGPGTAKSFVAQSFLAGITDAKVFETQLTGGATEDHVFGPLRMKRWKEHDVHEFNIEGRLADCELAYLEEFFDANEYTLRAMNEVTDENRKYSRSGAKVIRCPLHSLFATSNAWKTEGAAEAVADRFLLRVQVNEPTDHASILNMLSKYQERKRQKQHGKFEPTNKVSFKDIVTLSSAVPKVEMPSEFAELYTEVVNVYKMERGKNHGVTPRRFNWTGDIILSSALLDGRDKVSADDIRSAKFGICFMGREKDEEIFDAAVTKVIGDLEKKSAFVKELDVWRSGIERVRSKMKSASPDDLIKMHQKMTTTRLGLDNERPDSGNESVEKEFAKIGKDLDKLLQDLRDAIPEDSIKALA